MLAGTETRSFRPMGTKPWDVGETDCGGSYTEKHMRLHCSVNWEALEVEEIELKYSILLFCD